MELYRGGGYTVLSEASYNGNGERVSLTTYALGQAETTTYVTVKGELLMTSGAEQDRYHLFGNGLVGEQVDGQWHYFLHDGQASVRTIVDGTGEVVSQHTYRPFGGALHPTGSYEGTFGFLGAQVDRLSGLNYINGRYYDPVTGRFLTPDYNRGHPYVPFPLMMILLPGVAVLLWRGRKDHAWRAVVVVAVLSLSGLLVSCGSGTIPQVTPMPILPPVANETYHLGLRLQMADELSKKWARETLDDYARDILKDPNNGLSRFSLNLSLIGISQTWIAGAGAIETSGKVKINLGLAVYNDSGAVDIFTKQHVLIPPNLAGPVEQPFNPMQEFEDQYGQEIVEGNIIPAFDATAPPFDLPITDQETTFKFILAHEMTHALLRTNRAVFDSFVKHFLSPAQDDCLLVERNTQEKRPNLVAEWQRHEEIAADYFAASLYRPSLMRADRDRFFEWRDGTGEWGARGKRDGLQDLLFPRHD